MALSWFDANEEKALGVSLAQFFVGQHPADSADMRGTFTADGREETLAAMAGQLMQFKQEHALNIYKKAQFANAFKWALKEAGYDPAYIAQLTNWLLLRL